nr:hypothetical protein [Candidatus Sigynarchaeota archaeon]
MESTDINWTHKGRIESFKADLKKANLIEIHLENGFYRKIGRVPDILFLGHSRRDTIDFIPFVLIVYGEVVKTSFKGFPRSDDLIAAFIECVKYTDLAPGLATRPSLPPKFNGAFQGWKLSDGGITRAYTIFSVNYFLIMKNGIWSCTDNVQLIDMQLDAKTNITTFRFGFSQVREELFDDLKRNAIKEY